MKLSLKNAVVAGAIVALIASGAAVAQTSNQSGAWPIAANQKVVTTRTGLQYIDLEVGKGPSPTPGSYVSVHYTGWLLNKKKFDSSLDRNAPFEFPLGAQRVIAGWDEGVATMKVGGKRRLVVPPDLGYGRQGMAGVIPPNATLVFDVQLLKFSASPSQEQ